MISGRNRCPFTPTQWQELEHQALIYKYMVSGVPIPPELIYSVKTSLDSSLPSCLFPHPHHHQPTIGWGCFQVGGIGIGRKADPEPGRCRRTDGKKWRCSKEAYPDSKYCERHMHRGRNRSRKHVEAAAAAAADAAAAAAAASPPPPPPPPPIANSNSTTTPPPPPLLSSSSTHLPISTPTSSSFLSFSPLAPEVYTHHSNPFLYSHSYSHSATGFSASLHPPDQDNHRYVHGTREGVSVRSVVPAADSYQPSYKTYHVSESQSLRGSSGSKQQQQEQEQEQEQQQQQQHCFVLGTDIKSAAARCMPIKSEKDDETQKPVHQFFGDWPPRNSTTDSWLDLASNSGVHSADS